LIEHSFTPAISVLWVGGTAAGMLLLWTWLDSLPEKLPGASLPLSLAMVATGAAVALALSGSLLLGQLAGALAVGVAAAVPVAWRRPAPILSRGAIGVFVVVLAGLWTAGVHYADLPLHAGLLIAGAPALLALGQLPPVRRLKGWQSALVRAGAVLLPVALAVALAAQASPPLGMYS
jgi:hypothetical protein